MSSILLTFVNGQEDRLIYTFEYEFFPASIYDAPTEEEVKRLVCMHDRYMTKLYRENSRNQAISFQSTNIDWEFDEYEVDIGIPLIVTLAADVTTDDGSAVPSTNAMALYSFDFLTFIQSYLHESDVDYWRSVSGMYNEYTIGERSGGQLESGDCRSGGNGNGNGGVTRPPRGTEPPQQETTPPPTPAPTEVPEFQIIIAAVEYQFSSGKARNPTPEELDNLICLTNGFYEKYIREVLNDPSTAVQGTILQHFLNADETLWVLIALHITAETATVDVNAITNEISNFDNTEMVDYIQGYVWLTETGSLFRATTSTKFQASISDDEQLADLPPTCGSTGSSGGGQETTPPATSTTLAPTAATTETTTTTTTTNPPQEITTPPLSPTLAPTKMPAGEFLPAQTPIPSVTTTTIPPTWPPIPQQGTFAPTITRTTTAETQLPTIPEGENINPKAVMFTLQYEFEEGTTTSLREPTDDEMNNLLCRTDQFFMDNMASKIDEPILTYSSLQDYTFDEQDPIYPFTIRFVVNTTYETTGEGVDPNIVRDVMDVNERDIMIYIGDYVMDTTEDDIFINTNAVNFTSLVFSYTSDITDQQNIYLETPWPKSCQEQPTTTTANPTEEREETVSPNVLEAVGPVFVLEFGGFEDGDLRSPTQSEVEDLMCQTDRFFQERMQTRLGDERIESYGTFINWEFNSDNADHPISVTFLSKSTWGAGGDIMAALVVGMMMDLTPEEMDGFIQNYVRPTANGGIFGSTTSVKFNDYVDGGPTLGDLPRATCITTTSPPTAAPSLMTIDETPSPTPADAGSPTETDPPQDNPDDGSTPQPTTAPDENSTPRPTVRPTTGEVQPTSVPTSSAPDETSSPNGSPTISPTIGAPDPTTPPVVGPTQQTVAPAAQDNRRTGFFTVPSKFQISNLDGLKDPQTIRFSSGLDVAWSAFATEIVANVTKHWRAMGNRRLGTHLRRSDRILSIDRVANSAKVNAITERQCGPTDHLDATCLLVDAEYEYEIVQEIYEPLNELFISETDQALRNGTFQFILNRESPGTPLVVGNIPRGSAREYATSDSSGGDGSDGGKGGLKGWAKFLIVLLVLLLLSVPVILYFMKKAEDESHPLAPYEEEDFVYDFFLPPGMKLQTEVDDYEARKKSMPVGIEEAPQDSLTSSMDERGSDGYNDDPVGVGGQERAIPTNDDGYDYSPIEVVPIPSPQNENEKYQDEWEGGSDEWEEEEEEWEEEEEEDHVDTYHRPDQSDQQRRQSYDPSGDHQLGSSSGAAEGDNRRRRYLDDSSGASDGWENEGEENDRKRQQSGDPSGRHDLGSSSRQAEEDHRRLRYGDDYDDEEDGWENEGDEEEHSDARKPDPLPPLDSTDDETQDTEELMREHENNTLNLEHAENTNRMNQLGASLPYNAEARVQQDRGQDPQEGDQAAGDWSGYDDHLRGLVDLRSSHRGEEEAISFGETGDDEDSLEDEIAQPRQYRMRDTSQSSNYDSRASQMSMESEGGWDDTSGASSRTSSNSEEEALLWD